MDANEKDIRQWFLDRFFTLQKTAFANPDSYFHQYCDWEKDDLLEFATQVWEEVNLPNLVDNILPTRLKSRLDNWKKARNTLLGVLRWGRIELRVAGYGLRVTGCGLVTSYEFPSSELWVSSFLTPNSILPTPVFRLLSSVFQLNTPDSRLPSQSSILNTQYFRLPTPNSILPTRNSNCNLLICYWNFGCWKSAEALTSNFCISSLRLNPFIVGFI